MGREFDRVAGDFKARVFFDHINGNKTNVQYKWNGPQEKVEFFNLDLSQVRDLHYLLANVLRDSEDGKSA